MKGSQKIILVILLLFLVLLSYHGMMASKIEFFDFSFLLSYIAGASTVVCIGIGIARKLRFMIFTSLVALSLIISSAYTTQSIVNYQVDQAQKQGIEIVQSIQAYKENNGGYPASLASLNVDSTFFLGMFPRCYYYNKLDSTFRFRFQGSGGGTMEWSNDAQRLYWYD
jgi:hypothetical protein